jgi:hypothetical protein
MILTGLGNTFIYGKKVESPAAAGEAGAFGRRKLSNAFGTVLDEAEAILGESGKPIIDKLQCWLRAVYPFRGVYTLCH